MPRRMAAATDNDPQKMLASLVASVNSLSESISRCSSLQQNFAKRLHQLESAVLAGKMAEPRHGSSFPPGAGLLQDGRKAMDAELFEIKNRLAKLEDSFGNTYEYEREPGPSTRSIGSVGGNPSTQFFGGTDERSAYSLIKPEESKKAMKYVDFPAEVYGVFILIVARDFGNLLGRKYTLRSIVRVLFVTVTWGVNIWLQFAMLWYVQKYIVGQAFYEAQSAYRQYHAEVFESDGRFNLSQWKRWTGPAFDLCNLPLTRAHFCTTILFTWLATMLGELWDIQRLHRRIWEVESLGGRGYEYMMSQHSVDGGDESHYLMFLSKLTRLLIYATVIIPRLVICIALTLLGCNWLCATNSVADLILNSLALAFIVQLDEVVYSSFAPKQIKDQLKSSKFAYVEGQDEDLKAVWSYTFSILVMGLCFYSSYRFLHDFQTVIPDFNHDIHMHCDAWYYRLYAPFCTWHETDPIKNCFPYGQPQQSLHKVEEFQ